MFCDLFGYGCDIETDEYPLSVSPSRSCLPTSEQESERRKSSPI